MAELMAIEMAELIERGLAFATHLHPDDLRVRERPNVFLERVDTLYQASALGLALIGRTGDPRVAFHRWSEVSNSSPAGRFEAAARLLGISVALARLIEANHSYGLKAIAISRELRMGTLCLAAGGSMARQVSSSSTAGSRKQRSGTGLPTRESAGDPGVPLVAAAPRQ